jgi:tetratricopeptide (TPR) repeat protein
MGERGAAGTMKSLLRSVLSALAAAALLGALPAWADGIEDGNAGRQALLRGDVDEAIQLLTHAIVFGALTPQNKAVTLNLRGRAYLSKGQTEVALDNVDESIRLNDSADARYNRALVYMAQYRYEDALPDLDKAQALGAALFDVQAQRGLALMNLGRNDAAIEALDGAIRAKPDQGFAYRTRGHVQLNRKQYALAIADETKAVALDPKDVEAFWLRAYAYRHDKQLDRAIADYGRALAVDPADNPSRVSRADAYEEAGRYKEAAEDYSEWIRQNPRAPAGYAARGLMALVDGRFDAAASDFAKALSLKPKDAAMVAWLHLSRLRAGQDDGPELAANLARLDAAAWPAPLNAYFAGRLSAADLLAKAGDPASPANRRSGCDALFFLGAEDLARGRKSDGAARLQAMIRACPADLEQQRIAKADLRRAGLAAPAQIAQAQIAQAQTAPTRPADVQHAAVKRASTAAAPSASSPRSAAQTGGADPLGLRGRLD